MTMSESTRGGPKAAGWINHTVVGIILATVLSDVSHEMATAVVPLYLASISLAPAAPLPSIVLDVPDRCVSVWPG